MEPKDVHRSLNFDSSKFPSQMTSRMSTANQYNYIRNKYLSSRESPIRPFSNERGPSSIDQHMNQLREQANYSAQIAQMGNAEFINPLAKTRNCQSPDLYDSLRNQNLKYNYHSNRYNKKRVTIETVSTSFWNVK